MICNIKKDLVYVCSPLSAETAEGVRVNMLKAKRYMEEVSKMYNCRAVAPHAILPEYFDDHIPEERMLCINFGLEMIKMCKKLVVCGNVISKGMKKEIELARSLGIDIIYRDIAQMPKVKITIEFEGDNLGMHI